jgi:hypothetical protein
MEWVSGNVIWKWNTDMERRDDSETMLTRHYLQEWEQTLCFLPESACLISNLPYGGRTITYLITWQRGLAALLWDSQFLCRRESSLTTAGILKANSYTACRAHVVPLPYRTAKGLDCVFLILSTQCGHVWFTLAMPNPCRAPTMPFWKRLHGMGRAYYVWISLNWTVTAVDHTARLHSI